MPERLKAIPDEIWNWLVKILVPALIGISISIAVKMKNKRMKFIHIFLSLIIGIGTAYLTGAWIIHNFNPDLAPMVIAVVTILGEKIGYWLVFRFKVDEILEGFWRSVSKSK